MPCAGGMFRNRSRFHGTNVGIGRTKPASSHDPGTKHEAKVHSRLEIRLRPNLWSYSPVVNLDFRRFPNIIERGAAANATTNIATIVPNITI